MRIIMEKLNLFFNKIKELSFWQRIFAWRSILSISYEAYQEFKELEEKFRTAKENSEELKNQKIKLDSENENYSKRIQDFEKDKSLREIKIESLQKDVNNLNNELKSKNEKIAKFESGEEERMKRYEKNIAQQNQVKESLEKQRQRLDDDRVKEQEEVFQRMKKTWQTHETDVQQFIKKICLNNVIEYVDKVPFNGKPDNTIQICNEYIIFDAKSPSNDDLSNFPGYIIQQTKNVQKYALQQDVRKDIFLVVPTNTIDVIPRYTYNMSDYYVYIITKDSLEPIILALKKIEEYEFAEQLSPEDRDNICRVIGKFSHSTKRRIQIDQFFIDLNLDLLKKTKTGIPQEMLKQVSEIEQAEIINPPTDKRSKQLLTKDLDDNQNLLNTEIEVSKLNNLELKDKNE